MTVRSHEGYAFRSLDADRAWCEGPPASGIDAELLERMARIARELPGHVVSLDSDEAFEAPPESEPILRIDGVVAEEILERCYDDIDF